MKRTSIITALAALICLGTACSKFQMPNMYPPATESEAPAKYVPYQEEFINVPQGCKSLVYSNGTLVATCYQSGYVVLPKSTAGTKALADYQILNAPVDATPGVASENDLEMVVAFEDSKDGDHDYNDLVVQAKMHISNAASGASTVDIDITPIAMGATIQLGLGVVLSDIDGNVLVDKLITDDCRSYLFDNVSGFLNTKEVRRKYDAVSITVSTSGSNAVTGISWYLLSAGMKLYAANRFQACLDNFDMPQGLVLTNLRHNAYYIQDGDEKQYCGNDFWQYPQEWEKIYDIYPGFENAFLNGGDFSIFANPVGNYYDAIAADSDGKLTSECLYDVHPAAEESGVPAVGALTFYDNTGRICSGAQTFDATYNTFNHTQDNFILSFSETGHNAIDFSRGDYIEGKVTACVDFPFNIGSVTSEFDVTGTGMVLEGYCNGAHNWWRVQDAYSHSALEGGKNGLNLPLIFRISQEKGIEFFIHDTGEFETRLPSSNAALASILELGTDRTLYFGLFGKWCATATYEYLKVVRNFDGPIDEETIYVSEVSVSNKVVYVGQQTTLTATVLPENATNKAVTWASSDASIASVNATTGEVTGNAVGCCTVTATSVENPGISASCYVYVYDPEQEVLVWQNLTSSEVTTTSLEIIASGVPTPSQICFNNGDYLELSFFRTDMESTDKDLFHMDSKTLGSNPNVNITGHNNEYTQLYVNPSSWTSVGKPRQPQGETLFVRYGWKSDGTKGPGAYSLDGSNWTDFAGGDFETTWATLIAPDRTPLMMRSSRSAALMGAVTYDYLKIVRGGAND